MAVRSSSVCLPFQQSPSVKHHCNTPLSILSFFSQQHQQQQRRLAWLSLLTRNFRLAAGSFLLFFGRVADLFGRRSVLLVGMAFYSAFLLVAGFAPSAISLDLVCGLLGLCSAASVPAAIGILGAVYSRPSRRKNKAFACFSSGNPIGFGAGALLSGAVNRSMSWRASFWTLAVIYGLIAAISWWTVPMDRNQSPCITDTAKLTQLDWLGATTIIAGLALLLTGITYDQFQTLVHTDTEEPID